MWTGYKNFKNALLKQKVQLVYLISPKGITFPGQELAPVFGCRKGCQGFSGPVPPPFLINTDKNVGSKELV